MRAQRLNYLLQSFATSHHLISSHSPPNTDNMIVPFQKPWDFLFLDELEIFLYSEDSNVHIKKSSSSESFSIGLPTQLSMFDGKIILGSIYSCGYSVYSDNNIYSVEYHSLFYYYSTLRVLFVPSRILAQFYSINSKQVIHKLPLTQVHFARLIDNKLFCLDNSSFGIIYSLCCVTGELFVHNILPVMVCNDICKHFNTYYLIDKQQGSVFLFDESFQYIDRYLDYGYSSNNLADPVAIHSSKDKIYVLSWLTSRITLVRSSMTLYYVLSVLVGSKSVVDKNIRLLHGIPLFAHFQHAQQSSIFSHIVFSSDSHNYLDLASSYDFSRIFQRSANLSHDKSGKVPVIIDALLQSECFFNCKYDYIFDLDCTSPLRNVNDILSVSPQFRSISI